MFDFMLVWQDLGNSCYHIIRQQNLHTPHQ